MVIHLDRPAILSKVRPLADVLIADFGADDSTLVDVIVTDDAAVGRLPFELPSDMDSVLDHPADLPGGPRYPLDASGHRAD